MAAALLASGLARKRGRVGYVAAAARARGVPWLPVLRRRCAKASRARKRGGRAGGGGASGPIPSRACRHAPAQGLGVRVPSPSAARVAGEDALGRRLAAAPRCAAGRIRRHAPVPCWRPSPSVVAGRVAVMGEDVAFSGALRRWPQPAPECVALSVLGDCFDCVASETGLLPMPGLSGAPVLVHGGSESSPPPTWSRALAAAVLPAGQRGLACGLVLPGGGRVGGPCALDTLPLQLCSDFGVVRGAGMPFPPRPRGGWHRMLTRCARSGDGDGPLRRALPALLAPAMACAAWEAGHFVRAAALACLCSRLAPCRGPVAGGAGRFPGWVLMHLARGGGLLAWLSCRGKRLAARAAALAWPEASPLDARTSRLGRPTGSLLGDINGGGASCLPSARHPGSRTPSISASLADGPQLLQRRQVGQRASASAASQTWRRVAMLVSKCASDEHACWQATKPLVAGRQRRPERRAAAGAASWRKPRAWRFTPLKTPGSSHAHVLTVGSQPLGCCCPIAR